MTVTANPQVLVETNLGSFTIELHPEAAPATVENFLNYVRSEFYDGTLFHRVIANFMIQGGGFVEGMHLKPVAKAEIKNEAGIARLKNVAYAVAMARTSMPHSASSQFFINVVENKFLDFSAPTAQGYGYCVFGTVVDGTDTIEKIRYVATGRSGMHDDVPREAVVMKSVRIIGEDAGAVPVMPRFKPLMVGSVPATVRAAVWNKNGDHPLDYAEDTQGLEDGEMRTFTGAERKEKDWEGSVVRYFRHPHVDGELLCPHCGVRMHEHGFIDIPGIHSDRVVCPGDYVVTTNDGYHAMKPAVFEALYTPV